MSTQEITPTNNLQTLPSQLVTQHFALRADSIRPVSDPGARSRPGMSLREGTNMTDTFSFLASITILGMMRIEKANARTEKVESGVIASIRDGLLYVWNDAPLKIVFPIVMGLNLWINGPFAVGIPVVARTRFPEGAAAFGLIMSVFGGGALVGSALAAVLPRPSKKRLGTVSLSVLSVMGTGLAVIRLAPTMYIAATPALFMGTANGYSNIMMITWLQQKVAPELTGRIMSLVMFAAIGLNPVSTALAGALIDSMQLFYSSVQVF